MTAHGRPPDFSSKTEVMRIGKEGEYTIRWTKQQAWQWYNERPWIRGCNYMSADCANRVDQWQALGWEERLETTEKEFALMQETGFNTIRIILEYAVWRDEHARIYAAV